MLFSFILRSNGLLWCRTVSTRFDWAIFSQCNFPEYHREHPATKPHMTIPVYQTIFDKRSSFDRKRYNDEGRPPVFLTPA
jgi:hypothetical protein